MKIIPSISLIVILSWSIPAHFAHSQEGSELFPVVQNGKWGYINKIGKIIIKPQYGYAKHFSEGLAPVWIDGKYAYINTLGKIIIKGGLLDIIRSRPKKGEDPCLIY